MAPACVWRGVRAQGRVLRRSTFHLGVFADLGRLALPACEAGTGPLVQALGMRIVNDVLQLLHLQSLRLSQMKMISVVNAGAVFWATP